jgi:pimeloyl-ACP methyl ester carboxylesterase
VAIVASSVSTTEAEAIAFRAGDGRLLYGDAYGSGDRGVVILAHGGYSSRASWKDTAEALGMRASTFSSSNREAPRIWPQAGKRRACRMKHVSRRTWLAAVAHLRKLGAKSVALIGGSLGGAAVALAAIAAGPGVIESLVLLAPAEIATPEAMPSRKLFIVSRHDANDAGLRLPGIRAQFARVRPPKEFKLLEGSAHGQQILTNARRRGGAPGYHSLSSEWATLTWPASPTSACCARSISDRTTRLR